MDEPMFTGVGVALVTLFNQDGSLDAKATAALAVRLIDAGVKAIVVAGSTGEAAALEPAERRELLAAVRAGITPGSVPVLAGTGAPSAAQAVRFTQAARDEGADGVLALSPPGDADMARYYEEVAKAAGDLPVLAYHYPAVSAPGIPLALLTDLPVAGCKDSSGDANRLLDTLTRWDQPLYTGSAAVLSLAGPLGCAGAILALANAEPEACAAAFGGDARAQLGLAAAHRTARSAFPGGVKGLTAARFGTSTVARMG